MTGPGPALIGPALIVAEDAAAATAERIAATLRAAIVRRGRAAVAFSGGTTPWLALALLRPDDLDWTRVDVFQADERVAPPDDPARNLSGLRRSLLDRVPARLQPMPVEAADLDAAAAAYAASLPERLDLVQLGLGEDGHTASLVPGDVALDAAGEVAVTGVYRGHRRMTLTFPAINRARSILWLVTGAGKRAALAALVAGSDPIPANRVARAQATVIADHAAASPFGGI